MMRACSAAIGGWVGSLVLLAACAPKPAVPTPHALCESALPRRNGGTRPMRADDWMRLILVTESKSGALFAHSLCTGERIEHTPLPASCEVQTPDPGVLEPLPLTEASVTERIVADNRRLVWIVTHRFPNGDALGPVAAVTMTHDTVYVGALGLLRLRPQRVDLSLWEIGERVVLMGAGESCVDLQQPSSCRRAANLLVFEDGRFRVSPIRRAGTDICIDAPWVEFKREADLTLDNGWNRHMRINASVDHDQRYVVITEQVEVADTDPNHPDVPARDVRRIDSERFIHVEGASLYTRQPPLWPRIIPSKGETQLVRPLP